MVFPQFQTILSVDPFILLLVEGVVGTPRVKFGGRTLILPAPPLSPTPPPKKKNIEVFCKR